MNGGRVARRLLTVKPVEEFKDPGYHPYYVRRGNGQLIVQLAGTFYIWDGKELKPKGWPLRKANQSRGIATPNGFCYLHSVYDEASRTTSTYLIEFDIQTGRERSRLVQFMGSANSPYQLPAGWVVFTRHGYPDAKLDLAQLWHMPMDRWLRLPDGCLGRESLTWFFPCTRWAPHRTQAGHALSLAADGGAESSSPGTSKGSYQPAPWSEWGEPVPGIASVPTPIKPSAAVETSSRTLFGQLWSLLKTPNNSVGE